ncbi:DUF1583 domain-containing protein [bacterium]|nr:DUF1583 domain-containing protein [bacterium]
MNRVLAVFVALISSAVAIGNVAAQPGENPLAREVLFGEAVLASNAAEMCRVAEMLPQNQRFDRLAEWVFPNASHRRLRLDSEFGPTEGPASLGLQTPRGSAVGARLLSPVLLLVDLAAEQMRLDELRQRLAKFEAKDELDLRSETALRFLIELAAGNRAAARDELGRLYDQFAKSSHSEQDERWPETLVATRGIMQPQTQRLASELLEAMNVRLVDNVNHWLSSSSLEWHLHLRALSGLRLEINDQGQLSGEIVGVDTLREWAPGSRESAQSRGDGYPQAVWLRKGSEVRHLTGSWRDYLWFRSPLTGNYQVECEVTTQAWHNMQLMVAGQWWGMNWDGREISEGTFQATDPSQKLEEPMARLGLWSRLRAVVRDGICTISLNGRTLSEHPVTEENHPWVALRGVSSSHGAFRNVRIDGDPVIPEQVDLIRSSSLSEWTAPLATATSTAGLWRIANGEIVGNLHPEDAGTVAESLLTYCRPMLEDGEIEFEFLYEPSRAGVSPAIGRTVFLIEADGVRLHRVTNGRFERSDLGPGNRSEVIGDGTLPLQVGEWNRVRLVLRGDVVTLELNGENVARHTLAIPEQRLFGLFHFADQTEARVRKIVWRGDWPKQVPPVGEQELAAPDPECLEGLEALQEVVTYQFSQAIPTNDFDVFGTLDIRPQSDGLLLSPPVKESWSSGRFSMKQLIYGDFDAVLRVSGLKQKYGTKGTLVVELSVVDDAGTVAGCVRSRGAKDRVNLVAKKAVLNPDGTRQYSGARIEDELEDGTLRIVRRGAEIHALASHGDSPNYRHVGSNRLPSVVSPVKLELVVASTAGGHTEVVFHDLVIRSNSKAVEERLDPNVLALDQYVVGFRQRFSHDFADQGVAGFTVTGSVPPIIGQQGLMIRPRQEGSREPVAVHFGSKIEGEFDVAASLQLLRLPLTNNGASPVELSLPLPGDASKTASLAVFKTSEDALRIEARLSKRSSEVPTADSEGSVIASAEASSIEQLRIVRIQRSLLFVFSESGVARLLGQVSCDEDDLPGGTVSLVTRLPSGSVPAGEVRWKSFSVNSAGAK